MRSKRWGIALLVALTGLIAAVFLLPAASATFTSQVNTPATIAASATFPGLPKQITDKGPVFYHRMEETQSATGSSAAGSVAADATGSSPGVYGPAIWGPSLWWRFDETAGATSFSDVSGGVNTASINGTVTAGGSGPMGGSVTLGSGGSLSSLASPFRADHSFTMSVWANIGSAVPTTTRIGVLSMTGNSSGTPNGTGTYARSDAMITAEPPASCPAPSTSPCWAFAMAGNPQNQAVAFDIARGTSAVVANTWALLTAVFDQSSSTMTLSVNGTPEGSVSHTVPASAATNAGLDAGRYRDGSWLGTTNGTAQIGETRTWRRALSAAAITQLAVRPNARYAFTEGAGSTTSYTTAANSTGAPGAVGRTAISTANGAALAAGREGNAFTIGSTPGYLMGPSAQLTTTSSFTVAAWVRLTDSTADRSYFSANNGFGNVVNFGYRQSTNRWVMSVVTLFNGTVSIEGDVTAPVLNQWVHLVAVHDDYNNLLRLYVDGTPQTPVAFNYTPSTGGGQVVVGGQLNLSLLVSNYWQGQVDDLRLYNGYPLNAATTTSNTVQTFVNLLNPGLSAEVPGGLQGSTKTGHAGSTAVAFGGTGNGYNTKYSASAATTAFTVECLIRVGAGQSGVIAGFTSPATPTGLGGSSSDRLLYVDSAGKVRFGILQAGSPVTVFTVASAANVDDGAWHHITAGVGPITGTGFIAAGGLRLSLDGTVTSTSAATAAIASTGVWRWGGAPLLPANTWPSAPSNPYLTGTIDEFAVYDKQLTDQDDLWRVYGNY